MGPVNREQSLALETTASSLRVPGFPSCSSRPVSPLRPNKPTRPQSQSFGHSHLKPIARVRQPRRQSPISQSPPQHPPVHSSNRFPIDPAPVTRLNPEQLLFPRLRPRPRPEALALASIHSLTRHPLHPVACLSVYLSVNRPPARPSAHRPDLGDAHVPGLRSSKTSKTSLQLTPRSLLYAPQHRITRPSRPPRCMARL